MDEEKKFADMIRGLTPNQLTWLLNEALEAGLLPSLPSPSASAVRHCLRRDRRE